MFCRIVFFPLSAHDGPPLTDLTAIVNFKGENKCQSRKWQRRHLQFNPVPSFSWSSGGRRNHWAHCRVRLTVGRCVIKLFPHNAAVTSRLRRVVRGKVLPGKPYLPEPEPQNLGIVLQHRYIQDTVSGVWG